MFPLPLAKASEGVAWMLLRLSRMEPPDGMTRNSGKDFSGLVYAHQQQITIGQAVKDLELIAKALEPQDMRNRIEFIPF